MTQLIRYEHARKALAEAVMFDEVLSIRNVAEQAALYAKQANDTELIEKATEIKVRAERKAGEMLRESKETGARAGEDGRINQHNRASHMDMPTLAEIGVTPMQSSRWQSLAGMSEEHFETAVATAKDTAGQVTTAFMLREAGRVKPSAPAKKGIKADAIREDLRAAKERGVSMLETYARLTLTAVRSQDSFTDQERLLLAELMDVIAAMTAESEAKP